MLDDAVALVAETDFLKGVGSNLENLEVGRQAQETRVSALTRINLLALRKSLRDVLRPTAGTVDPARRSALAARSEIVGETVCYVSANKRTHGPDHPPHRQYIQL